MKNNFFNLTSILEYIMNTQLKKKHQISVNLYQKKKNFNFKNQQNRFKKLKHYKNLNLYYDLHNKIVRPHN